MKFLECYAYFSMTYMLTVFLSQDFAMSDQAAGATPEFQTPNPKPALQVSPTDG